MGIGFMTLKPQSIGWLGFLLDITQRKRLDSFLGSMLNLFKFIYENLKIEDRDKCSKSFESVFNVIVFISDYAARFAANYVIWSPIISYVC